MAAAEGDVVGDNAAGNAAGPAREFEPVSAQVFRNPSLDYCSLAVAVEDTHCFAQPKVSSAWNMDSLVERNSWRLVRANLGQDFAGGHIPVDMITNVRNR